MQSDIGARRKNGTGSCGRILKARREQVGLTQGQLSGLSNVSVRAIRDLELGKVQVPRRETIRLLADALGMDGSRRASLEAALADARTEGAAENACDPPGQGFPPISLGPLVGRQAELRAITELLGTSQERLVSVVGCTGVGKTRLAFEAAQVLNATSRVPVLWASPKATAGSAAAVRRPILPGWVREVSSGGSVDDLIQLVGNERALLVLDDLEESYALQTALMQAMRACPRLSVLTTNREPIFGLGRRMLPLAPLALPECGDGVPGADQPALAVMMPYLSHLRPDIPPSDSVVRAMARICRALDGLPGALESAASWLSLYEPSQLAAVAESSPLTLTESASAADPRASSEFRRSLEQSLSGLESTHAVLLRALTSMSTSWTVDTIAREAQCTRREATHGLHALLLRGFLRRTGSGQADQDGLTDLTVLNLVRHLIGRDAAARPALPRAC
jgi:transcriptional regulator with XRE-family HTH domain